MDEPGAQPAAILLLPSCHSTAAAYVLRMPDEMTALYSCAMPSLAHVDGNEGLYLAIEPESGSEPGVCDSLHASFGEAALTDAV